MFREFNQNKTSKFQKIKMFGNKKSAPVKRSQVDNQIPYSREMKPQIDEKELSQKLRKINALVINEEDQIEVTMANFE